MHTLSLHQTAARLVTGGRGILAADESIGTMSSRLEGEGVAATAATRRDYRQLLLSAPGLAEHVSGVIWCDETFRQRTTDGVPFPEAARARGVLAGIKVDTGTALLPDGGGATITEGLEGLDGRLADYASDGAAFAKWRAVFDITTFTPHVASANAKSLAAYAASCQTHGLVPIVEPEVLCAGDHDLVANATVTRAALAVVFEELVKAGVDLSGIVLKPNFVTPGLSGPEVSARSAAAVTFDVLRDTVPVEVPGIAFLSGGHPTAYVCEMLAEINEIADAPWALTFSFGRALVNEALQTWGGSPANTTRAQEALAANCAAAARATARRQAA